MYLGGKMGGTQAGIDCLRIRSLGLKKRLILSLLGDKLNLYS